MKLLRKSCLLIFGAKRVSNVSYYCQVTTPSEYGWCIGCAWHHSTACFLTCWLLLISLLVITSYHWHLYTKIWLFIEIFTTNISPLITAVWNIKNIPSNFNVNLWIKSQPSLYYRVINDCTISLSLCLYIMKVFVFVAVFTWKRSYT